MDWEGIFEQYWFSCLYKNPFPVVDGKMCNNSKFRKNFLKKATVKPGQTINVMLQEEWSPLMNISVAICRWRMKGTYYAI